MSVMNENKLIRRAAAEGYSVAVLMAAAERVQEKAIKCIPTGMQPGDGSIIPLEEIASMVARSTLYKGGYMYPGTDWGPGLNRYQAHAWSRPGESTDGAPVETVVEYLKALPNGAEIVNTTNFGNGVRRDIYKKEGSKVFRHTGYFDEQQEESLLLADYRNPEAVAAELGVACSKTLCELFRIFVQGW